MKETSPSISVTKWRVTKVVVLVILVVVWSLGDRAKDRRYGPGQVTLWVPNINNTEEQANKTEICWDCNTLTNLSFASIQVGGVTYDVNHKNQDYRVSFVEA